MLVWYLLMYVQSVQFQHPVVGSFTALESIKSSKESKGSLHEKKTEIVWSFTKQGGGYPPTKQFPFFSAFFLLLKNDLNALKHEINQ